MLHVDKGRKEKHARKRGSMGKDRELGQGVSPSEQWGNCWYHLLTQVLTFH